MIFLAIIAAFLAGGVLYRCRGGFIGTGNTNVARTLWWAAPTAALFCALLGFYWLLFIGVFVTTWLGLLVPHGFCQNKAIKDYLLMACVMSIRLAIIALTVYSFSHLAVWLPLIGLLCGLAYAVGWELVGNRELIKWHPKNPNADDGSGHDHFAKTGGEWAEVLTGAFLWAGIVALLFPWG